MNPYNINKFKCSYDDRSPAVKLYIYSFILNAVEVTFSNQIFNRKECILKASIIECNVNDADRDPEKVTLNLSTYQLLHQWLSYDSGKYIYDKTQVAKTLQLDSYRCISSKE
tara:strand:+ start:769 stop:1104 length:336 start_codon:yes stop_codon:yes gene_type:complete